MAGGVCVGPGGTFSRRNAREEAIGPGSLRGICDSRGQADRQIAIRACAPVYLGVLLHGYIPD